MTTVSGWDIRIDAVIRQVLRDVKRDKLLLKGSISNKRSTFLTLLKTALVRQFPSANVVIVRHGQTHRCLADHVVRKVEGPVPALSDFFGFGSYDYHVYVCRRGSFTNFGHGGPLDLVWAGPTEMAKQCGFRSQTLLLR